jgi:3-deoxy-7-phosphoheptulonate synthase
MFVVMAVTATEAEILGVKSHILAEGMTPYDHQGADRVVIAVVGEVGPKKHVLMSRLGALPGVETITPISRPFKLTSREFHPEDTVIRVLDATIGDGSLTVMAGPCSVESRDQLFETADGVKAAGATVLRGGAFKPRTSPYSFQGHGEEALRWMREAADEMGLAVVSEVMDVRTIEMMMRYVDCLQVGARNMQNFDLLKELGRVRRPVLLKRGLSATIEEWLLSAEYVLAGGNGQVILCERGIRTFENATRNTLDISAIPVVKKRSHLPIIVDPSHGTGRRDKVIPMARAAVAAGADGLLIEVHNNPEKALSDGAQSLYPHQFETLMGELRVIAPALGRSLPMARIALPEARG